MLVLEDWRLTPQRVALHLPSATAVVADLHLGYEQARQRTGEAVPLPTLEQQLAALGAALAQHGIRRLIVAGDLLEDSRSVQVLEDLNQWLDRRNLELIGLVPGNHDRHLQSREAQLLRLFPKGIQVGRWRVVHGDQELPRGRVVHGHEHPWARWSTNLSAPCYLIGRNRLILPAYSEAAAGVNVLRGPRWLKYHCLVIVGERVLDFGEVGRLSRGPGTMKK
jgi:putative SbcD/Mre11-related phosphoesterase